MTPSELAPFEKLGNGKAEHTPGPWTVFRDEFGNHVVEVATHRAIAIEGRSAAEVGANAALVAAAPDLLAALEWAMARVQHPDDSESADHAAYHAAQEAISKARAKGGAR